MYDEEALLYNRCMKYTSRSMAALEQSRHKAFLHLFNPLDISNLAKLLETPNVIVISWIKFPKYIQFRKSSRT